MSITPATKIVAQSVLFPLSDFVASYTNSKQVSAVGNTAQILS